MKLTENDLRLPYFYTIGDSVNCPTCCGDLLDDDPDLAPRVVAHYNAERLMRCSACLVWIGPEEDE